MPFESIRDISKETAYFLRNTYVPPKRYCKLITKDVKRQLGSGIAQSLRDGKRCVAVIGAKKYADGLVKHVEEKFPSKEVVYYSSDRRLDVCTDVNEEWATCDFLITTSAVTCGLSFDRKEHEDGGPADESGREDAQESLEAADEIGREDAQESLEAADESGTEDAQESLEGTSSRREGPTDFDDLFVYALNVGSCTNREVSQSCNRVRRFKGDTMTLGLSSFHDEDMLDKYPITKWEVAERLHQRKRVLDLTFDKSVMDMPDSEWLFKMVVRNLLEVHLNAVYLRQIALKYLELENVQVLEQEEFAGPESMVQASAFKTERDDWEWDNIRSITPREYEVRRRGSQAEDGQAHV